MKEIRFTFGNFAKLVVKRQIEKRADTFVIIYGLPRTGKSTLGFNLLIPYLKLMRKLYREGKSEWNPPNSWKKIFREYFACDAEDMNKKILKNPDRSFIFVDEGLDVVSWMHMLEREQRELIELIQKTGEKGMFTILITPSMKLLTKPILARAHYLFMIVDEPDTKNKLNYAFVFRNYKNPLLAENLPFGFKKITDTILKYPKLGEKELFEQFLISRDRFIGVKSFRPIKKKLYDLYLKMVKYPSIVRQKRKRKYVPYSQYFKMRYALMTLVYNLRFRDGKSVSQIHRLMTDKFGTNLISRVTLSDWINRIVSMEKKPKIDGEIELLEKEKEEISEVEDLEFSSESEFIDFKSVSESKNQ